MKNAQLFVGLLLLACGTLLTACGHGATACKVVDITHDLCDGGLRYLAKDGTSETVTTDDLEGLHKTKAAVRAAGSVAPVGSK